MTTDSVVETRKDAVAPSNPAGKAGRPDVLLVISHLGHGGAQRVVCNLANALVADGFDVKLLVFKDRFNNALHLDPRVQHEALIYAPPRRSFAHLAGLYRLARWLPRLRAHVRSVDAPILISFIRPTNVKVLLACLGLKHQRLIVCERNDPLRQPLAPHWNLLAKLLYRTADGVTVNSRSSIPAFTGWGLSESPLFLPNILTEAPAPQALELGSPTILAVGRLVQQKGYDTLIRALAEAGERLAGWQIMFLGEGPALEALQQLAKDLGVADRLTWVGHVADPFVYYRSATVFALPSRYEGMPNALLEAMSCGLVPVVSDASAGPLEVVTHGENGLVVPVGDAPALARALIRLAENSDERAQFGAKARATTLLDYDRKASLKTWKAVLGLPPEVLQAPPAGRGTLPPRAGQHHLRQPHLLLRQIGHFATHPRVWPDLARWLAKRVKDRVVGKDELAEATAQAREAGTAWCSTRVLRSDEAFAALGLETSVIQIEQRFPSEMAEAKARVDRVPFKLGGGSNTDMIYTLCEAIQATRVIETGVANGWSSLAILLSISTRSGSMLHSVDLPYLKYQNDPWVGIAVPERLHASWTLHRMADKQGLPKALAALETIDFAHYDSDKSVAGRQFAYPLLWKALRPGGLLFSDDIDDNLGFQEFCETTGQEPVVLRQGNRYQGILRKPDPPEPSR